MENNTPELETKDFSKDLEFQERLAVIKSSLTVKREAETFTLPKDEEEFHPEDAYPGHLINPTTIEEILDADKRPEFDWSDESFETMLAFFLRDESFFKAYRKWMKTIYLPNPTMESIYGLAEKYYDANHGLIPKEAIFDAIEAEIKAKEKDLQKLDEEKREKNLSRWREFPRHLYSLELTERLKKYIWGSMIGFLRARAATEEEFKLRRDTHQFESISPERALEFSKRYEEISKIGMEDEELKIRTWKDVDETLHSEADDWIVTGLIAKNDVNIWYGPPGAGKSHIICLVGNSTNDDKECLGIDLLRTPCTYIDLENTEDVRRHIKRVVGDGNMNLITLDDGIEIPPIDSAPERFEEFILNRVMKGVVFIDTLPMITNKTKFAESKWEADPVIMVLKRLCAKGYTFVLIFHSLKADPKTIKAPQELLGRAGHLVAIYRVTDAGKVEEKEDEDAETEPNKPKTLFVGTGANLKSRHKKYCYWLRGDMNEDSDQKGFKRMSGPSDPTLEKIQNGLREYIKAKEPTKNPDDFFPNQAEFIDLIVILLGIEKDKERKARKWIKQGVGMYWSEKEVSYKSYRYIPKL